MYTTAVCPYCQMAERLLTSKGVEIEKVRVDLEPARRMEMMEKTGRRTVPQIYLDGVPIGGFDELRALDRSGELALIVSRQQRPRSIAPGLGAPSMR